MAGLDAEQNRALFGKCNNPYGHGHNYRVQITVGGAVDAETGMVVNLADLDAFAQEQMLARFEECNLNFDAVFRDRTPSTENLCLELWRVWEPFVTDHPGLQLRRIRVEETNNNAFEYDGAPFARASKGDAQAA